MPTYFNDYAKAATNLIEQVGKKITIGVPLGIGKPIGLLDALYELAANDPTLSLTILTGLTLSRPVLKNELEKRFVGPLLEKTLGDYQTPLYEIARQQEKLPSNIEVIEFYLTPGKYLKNKSVQQHYVSTNYSHVIRNILDYSINVIAQEISADSSHPNVYSLSCNTDLFLETVKQLHKMRDRGKTIAIVGEVNINLPFMLGDALIPANIFTDIIDTKHYRSIFAIPKPKLSATDHLIGLYTSTLIPDGACLQIGIGKMGDSIASALLLREKNNSLYREICKKYLNQFDSTLTIGSLDNFKEGLYASTEMLSDSILHLFQEHIIKKSVYDHPGLQRLLNDKKITEKITPDFLDILVNEKIINNIPTPDDIQFLEKFGIIKKDVTGEIELGPHLLKGIMIHAAFFAGSFDFYQKLRDLSQADLQKIDMTSVERTNTVLWSKELSELQRQNARFANSAMMITLTAGIISDGLRNWQEVSGVGGQADFAYMAEELSSARFIINCPSTRTVHGKTYSNIIWEYPNLTLPRYARDIIVTEYGIADCRSKTDSEIIQAILNITDSRFQQPLLIKAKKYGKIPDDYQIPLVFQNNFPEKFPPLIAELRQHGFAKPYPLGSELSEDEQKIQEALLFLKNGSRLRLFFITFISVFYCNQEKYQKYLIRMQLLYPNNFKEWIYKKLLQYALKRTS